MSASEGAELRAAAAEKAALLGAAEERLARLEALHRIAQVLRCPLDPCCAGLSVAKHLSKLVLRRLDDPYAA